MAAAGSKKPVRASVCPAMDADPGNGAGMSLPEQLHEGLYEAPAAGQLPSARLVADFAYPEIISQTVAGELHCSVTSIDGRGRLAARAIVRRLGWTPGQLVSMEVVHGIVVTRRSRNGQRMPQSGFVVLPSRIRHRVGLYTGDRVLMAVSLDDELLRVYPPRVLAAALSAHTPDLWQRE